MNLASDFGGHIYTGGPHGPQPPPPPSRENGNQMRATINQTPVKQPMAAMPYGHMMQYGPMGRGSPMVAMQQPHPMMPMQPAGAMMGMSPYMMGMGPYGVPQVGGLSGETGLLTTGKKIHPPGHYITVSCLFQVFLHCLFYQ